jgi:hypothetical protein
MRKTTVYLSDEEAEALRRRAAETGTSQSELIREGIRRVTGAGKRVFHSMGSGDSGEPDLVYRFDEVLGEALEAELREQLGEDPPHP